jgi:hypothetical protein
MRTSGWSAQTNPMLVRLQAMTPGTGLFTSTHEGVNGNGRGNSTNAEFFMAGKVKRPRCGLRSMGTADKLNCTLTPFGRLAQLVRAHGSHP